jgi:hypothetical protein
MSGVRHWHGFGPWTGSRNEYGNEALRRPGLDPNDERTRAFISSTLPPVQTGHSLMRPRQTSADRTWTNVEGALHWLRHTHDAHLPVQLASGEQAYLDLESKLKHAEESLLGGADVVWAYYTRPSYGFVSFEVICCPHAFFPDLACPRPPM